MDIQEGQAAIHVVWDGQYYEFPTPVYLDISEEDAKQVATESIRNGIPGVVQAQAHADFRDFVVSRFPPSQTRPYPLIQIRPKTPFGG